MSDSKTCSKCLLEKPRSEFHRRAASSDGLFSSCRACSSKRDSAYYVENKESKLASVAKWRRKNLKKVKNWRVEWKKKNPEGHMEHVRNSQLFSKYGIRSMDYDRMINEQGDQCAICREAQSSLKKRLAVDHDHDSGSVRGLLCQGCNLMLGLAKDDPDLLKKAADYLQSGGFPYSQEPPSPNPTDLKQTSG